MRFHVLSVDLAPSPAVAYLGICSNYQIIRAGRWESSGQDRQLVQSGVPGSALPGLSGRPPCPTLASCSSYPAPSAPFQRVYTHPRGTVLGIREIQGTAIPPHPKWAEQRTPGLREWVKWGDLSPRSVWAPGVSPRQAAPAARVGHRPPGPPSSPRWPGGGRTRWRPSWPPCGFPARP